MIENIWYIILIGVFKIYGKSFIILGGFFRFKRCIIGFLSKVDVGGVLVYFIIKVC